jgi:hypothetical protein
MVAVSIHITISITISMDAAALKTTKHVADSLGWIRFMPASAILIADSASLNYAAIGGKLVERQSQRAGRKGDGSGGRK